MAIPILIDPGFLGRLIVQTYNDGLVPEIEGRIGNSNLMHACYKLRLVRPPEVIATNSGSLRVRVPVEGHVSIPWGWGTGFSVDAEADLRPLIMNGSLHVLVGEFEFNTLSIGQGCSLPQEFLRLIGPFIKGAIFPSGHGNPGGISMNAPVITIPLSRFIVGASEAKIVLEDFMISERGLVLYVALQGEKRATLPPQPKGDGYDIAMAIPQNEAQRLIELTIGNRGATVSGDMSMAIPDQTRLLDLLKASSETLISFGRRGLGRRALKSSSRVKVEYTAQAGAPTIEFVEGDRIILHDIPGHLVATAMVEMDMPTEGAFSRLRSFFGLGNGAVKNQHNGANTMNVAHWSFNEDFVIREVVLSVAPGKSGKIDWKVTKLDIDLALKWYLPERTIEEIVEFIGERVATSSLPQQIPTEMPLPGDIPIKMMLDALAVSIEPHTMHVRANMHIAPLGPAEQGREAVKELIEEQITNVLKNGL